MKETGVEELSVVVLVWERSWSQSSYFYIHFIEYTYSRVYLHFLCVAITKSFVTLRNFVVINNRGHVIITVMCINLLAINLNRISRHDLSVYNVFMKNISFILYSVIKILWVTLLSQMLSITVYYSRLLPYEIFHACSYRNC